MIYEVRTYTLEPGTVPQFEESFSEALPHREKYSPLAAFWHTDIGTLNQVVHVWGYEDLLEREKIRAEAAKDPNWPPRDTSMIMTMESEYGTRHPSCDRWAEARNWATFTKCASTPTSPVQFPNC